jgi:hypothetical protein
VSQVDTPSPWILAIKELAENAEVIYGAQSLAGKILMSKNLGGWAPGSRFQLEQDRQSAHSHGLDDDGASILWTARSDVTWGCGKGDFRRVGILRLRKCFTSFRTCFGQDGRTWAGDAKTQNEHPASGEVGVCVPILKLGLCPYP